MPIAMVYRISLQEFARRSLQPFMRLHAAIRISRAFQGYVEREAVEAEFESKIEVQHVPQHGDVRAMGGEFLGSKRAVSSHSAEKVVIQISSRKRSPLCD